MYGWTDPNDPEGAPRRPEPPTDEPPAWLTERPEPRSSYLFGDEPDQPGDRWQPEQPGDRWQSGQPSERWQSGQPSDRWQPDRPADEWHREQPTERWQPDPADTAPFHPIPAEAHHEPTTGRDFEPAGERGFAPVADLTAFRAARAEDPTSAAEGRHRTPRRFPRPMLIGGAAAAATLVVSLGVGALALTGDDGRTDPASVDDTVAAAPVLPETDPAEPLAPTPTASPTTARPTPLPSRTTSKPTPAPSRTTAPSRRNVERSSAPTTSKPRTTAGGPVSSQAQQVVNLVNAERAKAGCGAVKVDDKLMLAAQRHSQDQADHQNMSHDGSDGSDAGDRLNRVGYTWRTYGENVAWNQKTPAAVMDAWMNSSGHRANILNCAFTEIGVGIASSNGPYWTQVFAAPR